MNLLFGYTILEKIGETDRSATYRGLRENGLDTAIIKVLNLPQPSSIENARLRQEYEKIRHLNLAEILAIYDIIEHPKGIALVMEDFKGMPLAQYMRDASIDIAAFLKLAETVTAALAKIHDSGIIHGDLSPRCILVHPVTQEIKITDFAAYPVGEHPEIAAGPLLYRSPEQTGRLNRKIDERSDIYSLGVIFYEILTGIVPFSSRDPIEIIHSHIARTPVPPRELNISIPKMLSDIVMKLLAKAPEERYQTCTGLSVDLEKSRKLLDEKGVIDAFPLGQKDYALTLTFPSTLYGKEKEMDTIVSQWNRVRIERKALILIQGEQGSGKTAMVNEAIRLLSAEKGFILKTSPGDATRDVPYGMVIAAVTGLLRQIMTEPPERLDQWKRKITFALGDNGRVITEMIPELEKIIGPQPEVVSLGIEESLNRFFYTFRQMFAVFSSARHPVAFFLDNLHLADSSNIDLLQSLCMDTAIGHLMIVGTYLNDRDGMPRPLAMLLRAVTDSGVPAITLNIPPLTSEHIRRILAFTVKRDDSAVDALAEVIQKKTGGNAYAVCQLLETAYGEGLLSVNSDRGWGWDMDAIRRLTITENVLELLIKKISHLPDPTQEILATAACIGPRFDLEILAAVSGQDLPSILATLEPALRLEVIELRDGLYEFRHHKIFELIYSLIDDRNRGETHLSIGRWLVKNYDGLEQDDRIYAIINQINLGKDHLADTEERINAANLNRKAAVKSYSTGAYVKALDYAAAGIALTGPDGWERHYNLTRALYRLLAECQFLNNDVKNAEASYSQILDHCRSNREKASIYLDRAHIFRGIGKYGKSVDDSLAGLKILGVHLKNKPGMARMLLARTILRLFHMPYSINGIITIPTMNDRESMLKMQLYNELALASYFTDHRLMFLAAIKMVTLSLRKGNSSYSAFGFIWYGLLLSVLGNHPGRGSRYGSLALKLNGKYYNPHIDYCNKSTYAVVHGYWREHIVGVMELFESSYRSAQEAGDVVFVDYIATWMVWTGIFRGEPLEPLYRRCRGYLSQFEKFKSGNEYILHAITGYLLALQGKSSTPGSFNNGIFIEGIIDRITNKTMLYSYYMIKCHYHILFGNFREAMDMACLMKKNITGVLGMAVVTLYYFYSGIIGARLPAGSTEGNKLLSSSLRCLSRWSRVNPENFSHMKNLLAAEKARLSGKAEKASHLYDRAIEQAREGNFIHNEALACELAADFYQSRGKRTISRAYIQDARNAYLKWGAAAKVVDIDARYPEIAIGSGNGEPRRQQRYDTSDMDILALLKTAAEISSEIHLEHLIANIMKIILQTAGAQRGVLMMNRDGVLAIEAECDIENDRMSLYPSKPVCESGHLPESIVRYVERSGQSIIRDNAEDDDLFGDDPYIRYHKTKSVLCFPMIRQDNLEGIIYLENNAAAGAFSEEQLQVLHLLGTQAAISLQNAMLYEKSHNTEQILARQYEEIQSQYEELEAMNEVLTETHDELQDASFEMARMRNYLQNVIDSMPSAIISIDQNRTINLWNREAERIFGVGSGTVEGKPIDDVIPFFVANGMIIDNAVSGGMVQKSEKVMNLTKTDQAYHDIIVYPLSGRSGSGAVIRIDDITARINIESMIIQTEKMMSIGGLAAGMAHEINNPLGGILMSAQNIMRRLSSDIKGNRETAHELGIELERIRQYMEKRGLMSMIEGIIELGERASKIVENMLAYSRKSDSVKLPVNFKELIDRTIDLASKEYDLAKKYDFKHIAITREYPPEPMMVNCVSTEMEQVLLNLLKNAAQAMMAEDHRMENPVIIIRLSRNGDTVQLEVEDNGPGMTMEQCRRAFEPFYTTKKAGKGTGLGLSVSYFIITENHGGSMRLVSSPGTGARFIINLPA